MDSLLSCSVQRDSRYNPARPYEGYGNSYVFRVKGEDFSCLVLDIDHATSSNEGSVVTGECRIRGWAARAYLNAATT